LVVGSGAREHALCWLLSREHEVFCNPGNPGIARNAVLFSGDVVACAQEIGADLVLIGPEAPLISGLADQLRSAGFDVLGPGAEAARLEGSKAFSKALMIAAGVPTAHAQCFTDAAEAVSYAKERFDSGVQLAVKASGAALGKGVVLCEELSSATETLEKFLIEGTLGDAGREVLIEDRLVGREFSLMALVSGRSFSCFPPIEDAKRLRDHDQGPNTGGMGSFAPLSWLEPAVLEEAKSMLVEKMVNHLAEIGLDYRGVLFAGVMVQDRKPYCLEYNVRFGDPETQSLVRLLGDGFGDTLLSAARGERLSEISARAEAAVTVVMASRGYPESPQLGVPLHLGNLPACVELFHAGTALRDGDVVTSGGRVVSVSAAAKVLDEARYLAYEGVEHIRFEGMQFRRDIAAHA